MFRVCGCTGFVLAIFLANIEVWHLGLSHWVLAVFAVATVPTFFGLVMLTKIITGEEQIIYYHHEIAVMAVTALLLWLLHQPLLSYLDITILGIGTFLACGRIGCLMVGCCHGRPNRFGVCYRPEHASAGFPSYYVGVRLLPVQAIESIWVSFIVVTGTYFLWQHATPGTALGWYVINYGVMRFYLEFLRGDPERPYHLGFSEAQWISLFLMCGVVWAEFKGNGFHMWHAWATGAVGATMVIVALTRGRGKTARHRLLNPRHVQEVAETVGTLSAAANEIAPVSKWEPKLLNVPKARTSLGIQISAGRIQEVTGFTRHYAISSQHEPLSKEAARTVGELIVLLMHRDQASELIEGEKGVFHLLVKPWWKANRCEDEAFQLIEA